MRILCGSTWLWPDREGGSFRVAYQLSEILRDLGHEVVHLTGQVDGLPADEVRDGIRIVRFPLPTSSRLRFYKEGISAAQETARRLNPESFDLVVSHHLLVGRALLDIVPRSTPWVSGFYMAYALEYADKLRQAGGWRRRIEMPVIYRILARWERQILERVDRVAVLSRFTRDIAEEFGAHPDQIHEIPWFTDLERFSPGQRSAARTALGWQDADETVILAVRRLDPRMGLEKFIAAVPYLSDRHARLVLAGRGPEEERLRKLTKQLGIEKRVTFLGFIPEGDLANLYRAANLVVMPTRALEGFGISTIEAYACGRAVAGTPVGSNPEVIGDLDPRLLFTGTAPIEIARGIDTLLKGDLIEGLEERARARAETLYHRDRVQNAWGEMLDGISGIHSKTSEAEKE